MSDAILDACLAQDKFSRVACETAAKTGMIMVLGEISTKAVLDYQKIIRDTIKKIGYDDSSKGRAGGRCAPVARLLRLMISCIPRHPPPP